MCDTSRPPVDLRAILEATRPARPWQDGDQLPWSDPAFSRRMLEVHLDPGTNMATRAPDVVRAHVDWLLGELARRSGRQAPWRVLDVGCGPGLYLHELAQRGHGGCGFDFAPEPLRWARDHAAANGFDLRFLEADLTALPVDFATQAGAPFDAVTFWFGEFHAFRPEQARAFLPQLAGLLRPGGLFVLEFQPWDLFVKEDATTWSAVDSSPFSSRPHLWLEEFAWDESAQAEIHVHWIVDADGGAVRRFAQCNQAWEDADLAAALAAAGIGELEAHEPITGVDEQFEFPVLVGRKN
ncbi:MAG: class I SAM-dependent methyltransferase [bacterium]|nr:class I SAM-dependent methyltransferase [bacterium]MBK9474258.1 class I SAM-dependent methyltransferase [bacterium]MBK9775985.1 class I SAM-dependent methyltransferase [bacterium]